MDIAEPFKVLGKAIRCSCGQVNRVEGDETDEGFAFWMVEAQTDDEVVETK